MSLSDISDILELSPRQQSSKISLILSSANKKKMAQAPTQGHKKNRITFLCLYNIYPQGH